MPFSLRSLRRLSYLPLPVAATVRQSSKYTRFLKSFSSISTDMSNTQLTHPTEALRQDDKVTVITGGARGIGLAIAHTIADLGGKVAVLDVLTPGNDFERLKSKYGSRIKYHHIYHWFTDQAHSTDVTVMSSLENAFQATTRDFGRIDNCVTAAGIALDKPFMDYQWDECRRLLDINILGTFFSAQLAARQMKRQETPGSIVMIASIASYCAIPGQRVSIYGATKAAVRLLGKTLAVEMAPHDIRVNTLSPGFIATDMSQQFTELKEVFRKTPPMHRIGQREDLTLAVAYLLSRGASYTTGTDIAVTGGLHNGRIEINIE